MGFAFVIGAAVVAFVVLYSLPMLFDWWRDRQNQDDEEMELIPVEPGDIIPER